jgi:putative endonuclease
MPTRAALLTPDHDGPCRWAARIEGASRGSVAPARTRLARAGERLAAGHLTDVHGLEVLALNHRVSIEDVRGELDVIARDVRSGLLVICEVKARARRSTGGGALDALGPRQQARIRRMATVLLATGALRGSRVRFDLVAVDLNRDGQRAELVHLVGAW